MSHDHVQYLINDTLAIGVAVSVALLVIQVMGWAATRAVRSALRRWRAPPCA